MGRWLSTTAARYGRFGPFLSSSGLFNVLAGPWIVILLAFTAFHLALRSVNQARRLVRARAATPAATALLRGAPQGLPFELVHLPLPVDAVRREAEAQVSGNRQALLVASDLSVPRPRVDGYEERRSWASIGPLLTYLGPLLLVLGLLGNTLGGWRATDVTLIPGRVVQPVQAGGLALSLVDAGSSPGGRPAVVALTRGSQTRHEWLGYALPATWGPVWVTQRSSGPALAIKASSGESPLPLQSLQGEAAPVESLHLRFGQNESEQAFSVPARNLAFRIVSYESLADRGIDRPVFLVEGYEGTDPTPGLNQLVEENGTLDWQGVTLALQREAYVVVDLAAMPGLPLLLLGGLVLLAGVAITAWGGLTRTWLNAAAERDGTLLAVRVAAPAMGQAEVARVVAAFAAAFSAPGNGNPGAKKRAPRMLQYTAYMFGGAVLLLGLGGLASRGTVTLPPQARTWSLVLHVTLACLGLGAFVVGAAQSLWFAFRANNPAEAFDPALPAEAQGMRGRPGDPGRGVSLAAFPLLTAALILGSLWGLLAFASPVRPAATEMWLLTAWLLGSAYFHATSGWRPLRISVWLAVVLVMAALVAGIAAVLAASSLLTM